MKFTIVKKYYHSNTIKSLLMVSLAFSIWLLQACTSKINDNQLVLTDAASLMNSNPNSALKLIDNVKVDELSKDEYGFYNLLRVRALQLSGVNVLSMEELVAGVLNYFSGKANAPHAAFACYLMAKICEAKSEPINAIHYYLLADSWATSVGYQVSCINPFEITYNLAWHYKQQGYFNLSNQYLWKTLELLSKKDSSISRTHSLELVGLNYKNLKQVDSAMIYFNSALLLAEQLNYKDAKLRIAMNVNELLLENHNYAQAEENVRKLLDEHKQVESNMFIGLASLTLSKVHYNNGQLSLARQYAYEAKQYLEAEDEIINQISLYEHLILVEDALFNDVAVKMHRETLSQIIAKQNIAKQIILEKLEQQMKQREGQLVSENMKLVENSYLIARKSERSQQLMLATFLLVILLGSYLTLSHLKRKKRAEEDAIVAFLSHKYAKGGIGSLLANFISEKAESEEELLMMMDSIDGSRALDSDTSMLEGFKRKLLGHSYNPDLPLILTDKELELCYLVNTQRFTDMQLMDLLRVDAVELVSIRESLEHKLAKEGIRLPLGYRKVQEKANRHYRIAQHLAAGK